jgi:hypothetical protein
MIVSAGTWIHYQEDERDEPKQHAKDAFSFQCRYCLVVDTPEIPADLAAQV